VSDDTSRTFFEASLRQRKRGLWIAGSVRKILGFKPQQRECDRVLQRPVESTAKADIVPHDVA
jgi:hypothetical protein